MAQAKSGNQSTIALRAFLTQISKEPTTLADHLHQTSMGVPVVFMHFEMLGKLINSMSQQRNLNFGRACIGFVDAGIRNNLRFFFYGKRHVFSTSCGAKISKGNALFAL